MFSELKSLWYDLGSPSIVSAANAAILVYFLKKLLTSPDKKEVELMLELLTYRINELDVELKTLKDKINLPS